MLQLKVDHLIYLIHVDMKNVKINSMRFSCEFRELKWG